MNETQLREEWKDWLLERMKVGSRRYQEPLDLEGDVLDYWLERMEEALSHQKAELREAVLEKLLTETEVRELISKHRRASDDLKEIAWAMLERDNKIRSLLSEPQI